MFNMIRLPYKFNDLEPIISETSLRNHYEKLYKGYVDNFNKVLRDLDRARANGKYENIKALEKNLAFNGAGAILHTMYFANLTPRRKALSVNLINKIVEDFGNYDAFLEQFINSTSNVEGSGWGILGYSKSLDKLLVLQCEKHQDLTIWDFIPILVVDIWEHAYYLDYITDKKKYLRSIFDIVDWDVVSKRYERIKRV